MESIKILLVDDHPVVRQGFSQLLEFHPKITIIAQASNGEEAVDAYRQHQPDIVIMDLSMPCKTGEQDTATAQGGLEAVNSIIALDPAARIIILTVWESGPYPAQLAKAGVKGYLTKRCAADELLDAVFKVQAGETCFSASVQDNLNPDPQENPLDLLTQREMQIFTLLAQGHSTTQIAEDIFLSRKTVQVHRANILRKLGLGNNSELVYLAIRHGVVQA